MNMIFTQPIQCQKVGENDMDEEVLTKLALGCAKFVLDDPSIQNFEIKTQSNFHGDDVGTEASVFQSSIHLANKLEKGKGKKGRCWNSKGTGVFHPRSTFSQNSLPKSYFGTGVFFGMPPTNDNQKKNKLKKENNVQTSHPKKEVGETNESFELLNGIYLPSEWLY
nr:hypothetical protein Iba_chr11aCG15300 [Ipomoea batatas]GMD57331.1 hypothetical protein Iba_chr11eCG11740 [Ipomoea batatas]